MGEVLPQLALNSNAPWHGNISLAVRTRIARDQQSHPRAGTEASRVLFRPARRAPDGSCADGQKAYGPRAGPGRLLARDPDTPNLIMRPSFTNAGRLDNRQHRGPNFGRQFRPRPNHLAQRGILQNAPAVSVFVSRVDEAAVFISGCSRFKS